MLAVEPPQVSLAHMALRFPPVSQFVERFRAVLRRRSRFDFDQEVGELSRIEQAVAFLALLDLRRSGEIRIEQSSPFAAIRIVSRIDVEREDIMDSPLRLIASNPLDQLARTLEALLVVASAPLSVEELAEAADDHVERVEAALGLVRERYTEGRSGIVLEHVARRLGVPVGARGGGGVRTALREAGAAEPVAGFPGDAGDRGVPGAVLAAGHRAHPRRGRRLCGREPASSAA